ncbi:hypothetical protein [Paraburkholderia tropica]|uniref:hypothetical protein n=1 Tax=Paraburkholderia tropica TaxID=92647 RepID=UPI003D26F6EE
MTAKSIIQIDVEDSQFRAFYDLYQVYQDHLAQAPDDWKAAGEAINEAAGEMDVFSESAKSSKEFLLASATQTSIIADEIRKASIANNALLESLIKNTKAQKNFSDETERGNESLKKMKENAEGVAGSVFGIGKWLLKLGAWGAGLAGLGGILSGLGLKDLASSAVDTQRSARGLGMTPGQLTAFNQDFGSRYLDESTLGAYFAEAGHAFRVKVDSCFARSWTVGAQRRGVFGFYSDCGLVVKLFLRFRIDSPLRLMR